MSSRAAVTANLPLTSLCPGSSLQLGQLRNRCDPHRQLLTPEHANKPCCSNLACTEVEIHWHPHLFSETEEGGSRCRWKKKKKARVQAREEWTNWSSSPMHLHGGGACCAIIPRMPVKTLFFLVVPFYECCRTFSFHTFPTCRISPSLRAVKKLCHFITLSEPCHHSSLARAAQFAPHNLKQGTALESTCATDWVMCMAVLTQLLNIMLEVGGIVILFPVLQSKRNLVNLVERTKWLLLDKNICLQT